MGYTTNTQMSMFTPLESIKTTVGTWAINVSSSKWSLDHTAAADTSVLHIPVRIPGNAAYNAGGSLTSVDFFWINATADLTDITPVLQAANLPANGGTLTVTTYTTSYDSNHDTAAKRKTQAVHKMTCTFGANVQPRGDQELFVELTVSAAASSAFKLYGVKTNWILRV